jgi:thymidylate synthase (FAD)
MRIIEPSYEIITPLNNVDMLKTIEKVARTCYKSEDKISDDISSAERMIKTLLQNHHEAMIEFADIIVKFTSNRGFSHEMVRHRLCSFAQESTRYCNYSDDKFDNQITVIRPYWMKEPMTYDMGHDSNKINVFWFSAMETAEKNYFALIKAGLKAQDARGVLPNDLKTEINVKANIREWRAIFKLRTAKPAHPDMRRLMNPLLKEFQENIPILFDDIIPFEEE